MDEPDARLGPLLTQLHLTQCPTCQTRLTSANVQIGWNTRAEDDAVFGLVWLTCKHCGNHVKTAGVRNGFAQSLDDAINAFLDA